MAAAITEARNRAIRGLFGLGDVTDNADAIRTHADSMLAMLRNIGTRGASYDRAVMRQYQEAFNTALPAYRASPAPRFAWLPGMASITVDGFWGIQTAKTVYNTFRVALPSLPQPPDLPGQMVAWWSNYSTFVTQALGQLSAAMTAQILAVTSSPDPVLPTTAPTTSTSATVVHADIPMLSQRTSAALTRSRAPTVRASEATSTSTAVETVTDPVRGPARTPAASNVPYAAIGLGVLALGGLWYWMR